MTDIASYTEKGSFSIKITSPSNLDIPSFRIHLGKKKPKPKREVYYRPFSSDASGPIGLFLSFLILRRSQAVPVIEHPDYIFTFDAKTNKEYTFYIDEGDYYVSADSIQNADFSFSPLESKEFIFTFGYSHKFPKKEEIDIQDYEEKKCSLLDEYMLRDKFRMTAGAYCPKLKIKKGKKTVFTFSGSESKISFMSVLMKPLFFIFLIPVTNIFGYYTYRDYTTEITEIEEMKIREGENK